MENAILTSTYNLLTTGRTQLALCWVLATSAHCRLVPLDIGKSGFNTNLLINLVLINTKLI